MFTLKIIKTFSAAHNLRNYKGKCERLHGHNWKVEVEVKGPALESNGLLVDFHDLKTGLEKVLSRLDHQYLNETKPFDTANPTSENLARYIFQELEGQLKGDSNSVHKVTVWESDSACASFEK